MCDDADAAWRDFRNRLQVGQLVDGLVVEHRPFGMFVDMGHPRFLGLVELPNMNEAPGSRPGRKEVIRPAIGTRIRAVLIGFGNPDGRQPRLRVRRTALRAAEALQQVADLPVAHRRTFLRQALYSHEPDVPVAAIWRVRYLPAYERAAFLREALQRASRTVQGFAVGRVEDLAEGERTAFLDVALEHENERIAWLAVWESGHLQPQERATFLWKAQQHAAPDVAWRALFELERLPGHDTIDE